MPPYVLEEKLERHEVLERTRVHVREAMLGENTGHDWWHTERVVRLALRIARAEGGDPFVVELASLLHDLADWKFAHGDESAGPRAALTWLTSLGVTDDVVSHVCEIIESVSFKGAGVPTPMRTPEGSAVQDADRLDALGAIGIARAFAYGAAIGQQIHNPDAVPHLHASFEAYKESRGPTTAHFREKLLLLKDRMNTTTGRRLAEDRHLYMERFLDRFYREWEAEDCADRC